MLRKQKNLTAYLRRIFVNNQTNHRNNHHRRTSLTISPWPKRHLSQQWKTKRKWKKWRTKHNWKIQLKNEESTWTTSKLNKIVGYTNNNTGAPNNTPSLSPTSSSSNAQYYYYTSPTNTTPITTKTPSTT